jgi:large subunit ribosomal protein L19
MDQRSLLEKEQVKEKIPSFSVGDTLKVQTKVTEGDRTRTQTFTGILIARKGSGLSERITLRKVTFGEGVEKVIPLHSPSVEKIAVQRHGKSRRAKLYYLREKVGRKARVKEKRRKES